MLIESLASVEERFNELNQLIQENINDYQKVAEFSKEKAELEEIVSKSKKYQAALKSINESEELLESEDEEIRQLAELELESLRETAAALEEELKNMLVPKDPRDNRNVIMEIRAGTGGDEAGLFAAELFRMYSYYAENRRWSVDVVSQNETGIGGIKEIIFMIKGRGAYSRLKFESGVHRVQRIPSTESSGRIHTSTVTVAVLAEVEDVDIDIPDSDLKIDVYRSAGAGGQNVQKNATAIQRQREAKGRAFSITHFHMRFPLRVMTFEDVWQDRHACNARQTPSCDTKRATARPPQTTWLLRQARACLMAASEGREAGQGGARRRSRCFPYTGPLLCI